MSSETSENSNVAQGPWPSSSFDLKAAWPQVFPGVKIKFRTRMALNKDEEAVQQKFFALEEQDAEAFHQYDAELLAQLSVAPPEGLFGFKPSGAVGSNWRAELRQFLLPDDPDARMAMAFVCRQLMSSYWRAITPVDFL